MKGSKVRRPCWRGPFGGKIMFALQFSNNPQNAQLLFDAARIRHLTSLTPSVIDITRCFMPERLRVETFIRDIYHAHYAADITVTYPALMSVRNADGEILAAVGFRLASEAPLFLEQYTRQPIEQVLKPLYRNHIARHEIVEIGNLASAGKGASIFLFGAIASYLLSHGIRYATVTGTEQLRKRFRLLGLEPHTICDADRGLLETAENNWGSYYATQPKVLAGSLDASMQQLNRQLGALYQENGVTLLPRLHHKTEKPS